MSSTRLRTLLLMVLAAVLTISIAGCSAKTNTSTPPTGSGGSAPAAPGATVTEKGFAFSPATLTVKVGETVTFVNEDSAPHNVNIDGAELGSQNQGDKVTWTATKAGSFPYSCVVHPSMTGQITVQ